MTDDVCGIYLITNKNTGQMYVGQSINIQKRFGEHRCVTGLGHSRIDNAINKHGAENFSFEIIMTVENDTEKLNDAEREWIAILNTYEDDFHYNLTPGGDFSPSKLPEVREKISKTKNTTGYFRVHKSKNPECRQGFRYCYRYYDDNGKRHSIQSVDIKKLEKKVKAKGLEWFKLGDGEN